MAISDRIKAEARRTIDGIQRYYEKYGEDLEDAEEREHRIARIEAAMDGCNGLSQEEKIQKTAENVFELTCAQERTFDSMHKELRILRDENRKEFEELRKEFRDGIKSVKDKIEESGCDGNLSSGRKLKLGNHSVPWIGSLISLISDHPLFSFNVFFILLVFVFVSGHLDSILSLFGNGKA